MWSDNSSNEANGPFSPILYSANLTVALEPETELFQLTVT